MKFLLRRIWPFLLLSIVLLILVPAFYQPENNPNTCQALVKKGAFHIHSTFSDGTGDVDAISHEAARAGLDFVILNDHGNPNPYSATIIEWQNQVLVIGGSEASLHSGHLAFFPLSQLEAPLPPEAQDALLEIERANGVSFIAHPYDRKIPWTDWDIHDVRGIEILNAYQSAKSMPLFKWLVFPLQYLLNPNYSLTSIFRHPQQNLRRWDVLLSRGKCFAIFALDAHGQLPLSKKTKLSFPSYLAMFRILRIYVKLQRKLDIQPRVSAQMIQAAIHQGRFFNVIESIAPANGFDHYLLLADGQKMEMGESSSQCSGSLVFEMPFPFATRITVYRNGQIFTRLPANRKKRVEVHIEAPGVYRSEIRVGGNHFAYLPWIVTNPFFVGVAEKQPEIAPLPSPIWLFPMAATPFTVEKNANSEGAVTVSNDGEMPLAQFSYTLRNEVPATPNCWVALALRESLNLSRFKGICAEVLSTKRTRLWLQVRTARQGQESSFRRSFVADSDWQRVGIPFNKFYWLQGPEKAIAADRISALFFYIDGEIAYPPKSGTVLFRNLGLY